MLTLVGRSLLSVFNLSPSKLFCACVPVLECVYVWLRVCSRKGNGRKKHKIFMDPWAVSTSLFRSFHYGACAWIVLVYTRVFSWDSHVMYVFVDDPWWVAFSWCLSHLSKDFPICHTTYRFYSFPFPYLFEIHCDKRHTHIILYFVFIHTQFRFSLAFMLFGFVSFCCFFAPFIFDAIWHGCWNKIHYKQPTRGLTKVCLTWIASEAQIKKVK